MASVLAGKRIVVTRRVEQAASFCKRLRTLGAEPILFPTIELTALPATELDRVMDEIGAYDWLLFTSANAIRFFFASNSVSTARPDLPSIAVVGSATGDLLSDYGYGAAVMPKTFTGEGLAQSIGSLQGRRVLLPRAKQGRADIVDELKARGAKVHDIALYDTVMAEPRPEALAAIKAGVDVLTFTSPLTAEYFYRMVEPDLVASAIVACIGPTTANTVQKLGVLVHVMPPQYTIIGLTDALIQYFHRREVVDVTV